MGGSDVCGIHMCVLAALFPRVISITIREAHEVGKCETFANCLIPGVARHRVARDAARCEIVRAALWCPRPVV